MAVKFEGAVGALDRVGQRHVADYAATKTCESDPLRQNMPEDGNAFPDGRDVTGPNVLTVGSHGAISL